MNRWLLAALLLTATASADDRISPYLDHPLDFSLRLSHHTTDIDYGGATVDTSFDRVALFFGERYRERLLLSLIVGWTDLTQTNNPATSGKDLNGYHAGFGFDLAIGRIGRLDLFASGDWLYQKVDHEYGGQKIFLTTREPNARLGASFALGAGMRAYGGVRYGDISGEQRLDGLVNETRKIKSTRETGGFAGAELELQDGGYIRLNAESGSDRSVAVYFGKRY